MNKRSSNVDLARFIASLLIMAHHLYIMGFSDYYFKDSWIYVEFFLIITGYYTAKHFDGKNYNNPMKESIIYTLKKFIHFLPYTIISITLIYLGNRTCRLLSGELNIKGFIFSFTDDFIFENLFIIESYSGPANAPLWYLSALFIVFPLFSLLMQIRNRYWILFITSFYSLFYYGVMGVTGNRTYPNDFFRVIAGLCIGAFIYEFIYAFSDYISNINKNILTFIEIIAFILPIVIIFNNLGYTRFILFCFTICLAIMLPNLSYTSKIGGGRCKVFNYLGNLSMPIFIIHWFIGKLIEYLSNNIFLWSDTIKIILYYGITIIVAMTAMYLVDHWKWFQSIIKKPIILKD